MIGVTELQYGIRSMGESLSLGMCHKIKEFLGYVL
jgi:hypothetical protein